MKQLFIFLLFSVLNTTFSFSQESSRHQAAYLEGFGSGIVFSFNYESRFKPKPDGFGYRAGLGLTGINGVRVITVPLGINYLLGKEKNFFELGMGVTFVGLTDTQLVSTNSSSLPDAGTVNGFFNIGYRRVFGSGLMLKAGISPIFTPDEITLFWPLIGFGFHF